MNNDLISREDFKIELTKQIAYYGERAYTQSDDNAKIAYSRCKDGLMLARQMVDNAPSVESEITEKQAVSFLIKSGWLVNHDKELRGKWERPHGEWRKIKEHTYLTDCVFKEWTNFYCSVCNAPDDVPSNFCPNCGADMRPEKKLQTPSCLTNPERQAELLERYKEE
jgi:hypothetical protein